MKPDDKDTNPYNNTPALIEQKAAEDAKEVADQKTAEENAWVYLFTGEKK